MSIVTSEVDQYRAWFAAQDDPAERYPLTDVVYYSRSGGLLEVQHDMDALRQRSGAEWRQLFESRWMRTCGPTAAACGARRSWCAPA